MPGVFTFQTMHSDLNFAVLSARQLHAQLTFLDERRVILEDLSHSGDEKRYYCLGSVAGEILTVRFTYRDNVIRIIGAGFWRKGKKLYEEENKIHR